MDFLLSDELKEFRLVLKKFLAGEISSEFLRKRLLNVEGRSSSFGEEEALLWTKLVELGALCAGVPEEYSGLGFGSLACQVVIEESARVLLPLPIFETLALGFMPLVCLATQKHKNEMIGRIALGELRVTGAFEALGCNVTASASGKDGGYLLSGSAKLVPSIHQADILLVPATVEEKNNDEPRLFLVKTDSSDISIRKQPTFDLLRSYAEVQFQKSTATLISDEKVSSDDWQQLNRHISVLAVGELVGVGLKVLSMTIEYVKTREQFNRPIGSFQAIQHKISDMHTKLEQAQTLARFAAWTADADKSQFPQAASAAKAYASEVVPELIENSLQAHGGIGFTHEYDLHLYLRRAKVLAATFGGPADHYRRVGELLLEAENSRALSSAG